MTTAPIAIRAQGLRKAYRIYQRPLDLFVEAMIQKPKHLERVALESVDLELRRGEIVGVLGRNGAGKSTMLKLITGTLERTSGELEVNGRITAILELGTGFHPDYTGRENIYMGGLCLGMSRREIDAKIDTIIDFSELRDYIDQPFKTYSTGMQARLTFSTATSVEPDILVVDEALSVGDARFQQKCFNHLQKLREKKTTILLVSHDTNTITSLCDRALVLENGRVFAIGNAKKISVLYHNLLFGQQTSDSKINADNDTPPVTQNLPLETTSLRYGTAEAQLIDWGMFDSQGNRIAVIESGHQFFLSMTLFCKQEINDLSCGFAIKDRRGTVLWGITNITHNHSPYKTITGETLKISVPSVMWLAAGDYFVTLGAAHLKDGNKIDFIEDAIEFRVIGPGNIFTTSLVNLQSEFKITSSIEQRVHQYQEDKYDTQLSHGLSQIAIEIEQLTSRQTAETLLLHLRNGLDDATSEHARYHAAEALSTAVYPKYKFSEYARIFLEDEKFLSYYQKFMDVGNWHSFDRKYTLEQLLKLSLHLEGDLVECGIYQGASAYLMCQTNRNTSRIIHLFDSFEGLSAPMHHDGDYWSQGDLSMPEHALHESLAGFDNYRTYKGWIPERFSEVENQHFNFLHIDVDLYQPTLTTLEFFYSRMVSGGIILMDDYGFKTCPGAKRAADEFFSNKSERIVMLPTGQAFVIKR